MKAARRRTDTGINGGTDRLTDGHNTDAQTDRQVSSWTVARIDSQTGIQTDNQGDGLTQTGRQPDGQIEGWTDRRKNRQITYFPKKSRLDL